MAGMHLIHCSKKYCMKFIKLLQIFILFPFLCNSQTQNTMITEGQIILKQRMYDKKNKEIIMKYLEKDKYIWFKDSCVIIEGLSLNTYQIDNDAETWNTEVIKYIYLDLKTMIFHDYKNFSDTAIPTRKYKVADTVCVGWNFYRRSSLVNTNNTVTPAPDTIINYISYKRLKGVNIFFDDQNIETRSYYTYYMRCDKKNTIFHIDRLFDEKVNDCPAIRFDFDVPGRNANTLSTSYDYASYKLTKREKGIFKKWAENAKKSKLPLLNTAY
jgi:hypothetical protein